MIFFSLAHRSLHAYDRINTLNMKVKLTNNYNNDLVL